MCDDEGANEAPLSEREQDADSTPFPDSDLPPALQRTIKRKLEEEEDEGPTEEEYREALRRAARSGRRSARS